MRFYNSAVEGGLATRSAGDRDKEETVKVRGRNGGGVSQR